jgi:hypothetical protein
MAVAVNYKAHAPDILVTTAINIAAIVERRRPISIPTQKAEKSIFDNRSSM